MWIRSQPTFPSYSVCFTCFLPALDISVVELLCPPLFPLIAIVQRFFLVVVVVMQKSSERSDLTLINWINFSCQFLASESSLYAAWACSLLMELSHSSRRRQATRIKSKSLSLLHSSDVFHFLLSRVDTVRYAIKRLMTLFVWIFLPFFPSTHLLPIDFHIECDKSGRGQEKWANWIL